MIYGIVTLVTLKSGNYSRIASDSQEASAAAAECSHTVSLATHVLPVCQTCPPSAPKPLEGSRGHIRIFIFSRNETLNKQQNWEDAQMPAKHGLVVA